MTARRRSQRRPSLQLRFIVIAGILSLSLVALQVYWTTWSLVPIWLVAWTVVTFLLFGYDKLQARRRGLRIPEISLHTASAVGGFMGAIGAMLFFRHKYTKATFWLVNIGSAGLFAIIIFAYTA